MLLRSVLALATLVAVVRAGAAPAFDYRNATADQVSEFKSCGMLKPLDIASMPPRAFAGFRPDCVQQINSFGKIDAEQFANFTADAIAAISYNTVLTIPMEAFSGATSLHVGAFNNHTCKLLLASQFAQIPLTAFVGFTKNCTAELSWNVNAKFDTERFNKLSLEAVGGFGFYIYAMPTSIFANISSLQLQSLSTGSKKGCGSLGAAQIESIPATTWAAGITQECLNSMYFSTFSAITAEQLSAMPISLINNIDDWIFRPFGNATCKGAQQLLLTKLGKKAFSNSNLLGSCFNSMNDDALASLADWQLYEMNLYAVAGFRSGQWARLPAEKITKFYGSTLSMLPPECCAVMTAAQLESICHVAIAGLHSKCIAELPVELGKSLDTDRAAQLSAKGLPGANSKFFRQIRPSALATFSSAQVAALNDDVCRNMRPPQFEAIPASSWTDASRTCVADLNARLVESLTLEHVVAMKSLAWSGFTALHHYSLIRRFGKAFLEAATLDKINSPFNIGGWWQQADCIKKMYKKKLLDRIDGDYSPNWMVLLSRPKSVRLGEPVLASTFLAGLRGSGISKLTVDGLRYVTPTEFGTLTAEQINELVAKPGFVEAISGKQLSMMPTTIVPSLSSDCIGKLIGFDKYLTWFTCAQLNAITEQQMGSFNNRTVAYVQHQRKWCAMPVNDRILYDGVNGQRWSERKKGLTYELECGIDPSAWSSARADRSAEELVFASRYYEKQVAPATGCPCDKLVCSPYGVCMEEPAATCQYVEGQSNAPRRRGSTLPPVLPPPSPGVSVPSRETERSGDTEAALSTGGIIGIVCAAVAVLVIGGFAAKHFKLHSKMRERWQYNRVPQLAEI